MGPPAIDWVAPLIVLAAGVGLGVFLWRRWRAGVAGAPALVPAVELRDLAGRSDSLVRQLRELEDTVSRWTEPLARERYNLELELARVLLALEEHTAAAPKRRRTAGEPKLRKAAGGGAPALPASAAGSPRAARPALQGFVWGAGSAVALGLLLLFVWQAARPRPQGGSVTGEAPTDRAGASAERPAAPDDEEALIQAALARNPDNLDAHLELARVRLARRDMMGVWEETQYVLRRSPKNPRALTYQSLVHVAMGKADVAVDELKRALAAEPDLVDAHRYLAYVYLRMGREKDAEATITNASRRFPTLAPELAQQFGELRRQLAASGERAGGDATAPGPGLAKGGVRNPAGHAVTLVLELDPALQGQVAPGSVLFVTAREAGVEKGPPAAAKRLAIGGFPMTVTIDDADSMAGEPLPGEMRIEARIDSDGDPITRSPSDPVARIDHVKIGASGVRLVLSAP
jgi:tetratricopeptide (TPR) repeat protein